MINIKNLIENAVYIILIGGLLIFNTWFVLKGVEKTITHAIDKNTTEITNKIDKIKGKKSYIPVDMKNDSDLDSINVKNGWFLFKLHKKKK